MLGTLPDLDVVIDYGDAVADMTYHRGFSHSLFVLTGVALLLTWLTRRFRHNPGYSSQRLFLTIWLVLITHPLLDSFTSYGTQLFWPLTPIPTAWSSIFIIDPLYTVPLLIAVALGLLFGLRDKAAKAPALALLVSSLYLASTLGGKYMAEQRVEAELARQGIQAQQLFSTPTPFNSLLWRVIVLDGEDYHEALVSWFDAAPTATAAHSPWHAPGSRTGRLAGACAPRLVYQWRTALRPVGRTAGGHRYSPGHDWLSPVPLRLR